MANEKRLIDARYLTSQMYLICEACNTESIFIDAIIDEIDNAPDVDAVEVVPGRWEDFCRGKMCCCSACKAEFDNTCNEIHDEWKFCPNCGAKMDGERKGND